MLHSVLIYAGGIVFLALIVAGAIVGARDFSRGLAEREFQGLSLLTFALCSLVLLLLIALVANAATYDLE